MAGDAQFINLPLLSTFLKYFSRAYLGPSSDASASHDTALPDGVDEFVPAETQSKIREMFVGYFNNASKTLVKGQIVSSTVADSHTMLKHDRNCLNKTREITRRTSNRARSLKIVPTPTKR